jgi:hypothetical protein
MLALTRTAAAKIAAKAAANWFWTLVISKFLLGSNWGFANPLAKMQTTLHEPCQFIEIYIYQIDRGNYAIGQHEPKLNIGKTC